jgi:prevent-host-death family protein
MSMSTAEARKHLRKVVDRAAHYKSRTIITRHGEKVAAVVPIEDLRLIRQIEDKLDLATLKRVLRRARKGDDALIPWDQARKELGL